ncbi:hypothetical protein C2845_PM10G13250 [Panicum miliaceum]|uniref:DJ-1/PfpI domain-containing protein n=1 Tax=Panicum miliaceum TaxID=4540 RepID=A0A3L6PH53_PANMI|nr:hypothetical protein C2845_PM10G13250 [Panicum miliaceum]
MATRPLASVLTLSKTPRAPSSGSHHSPPALVRRLQTLTRALASSSPQAMASPPAPKKASSTLSSLSTSFAPRRVLVPIANGTELMEAVITIDVLRRAGADVAVASVEPGSATVAAAWGVKLAADALLADIADAEFDLISLPGGMPGASTFRDCKLLENVVRKHVEKGKLYAAICAAPAVALGTWGLLNGLKATCYPSFMDKLPSEVHAVESRVQIDGKCVTSRGPGMAMEDERAPAALLRGVRRCSEHRPCRRV